VLLAGVLHRDNHQSSVVALAPIMASANRYHNNNCLAAAAAAAAAATVLPCLMHTHKCLTAFFLGEPVPEEPFSHSHP